MLTHRSASRTDVHDGMARGTSAWHPCRRMRRVPTTRPISHAPNRPTTTCLWRLLARNLHAMLPTRWQADRTKRRGRQTAMLLSLSPVDAGTSATARQGPFRHCKRTSITRGSTSCRSRDLRRQEPRRVPGQSRCLPPLPRTTPCFSGRAFLWLREGRRV